MRIAGDNWEPLPIEEECEVFLNIELDDEEAGDEEESKTFAPLASVDTQPPKSGYARDRISSQLPQDEGYDRDPPGIDDWPRRLLYVPSMTSVQWSTGGVYFHINEQGERVEFVRPRYHAISYTWGRYALQHGTRKWMKVSPLEIKNIDWDVPRIDQKCFTKEEFRKVVHTARYAVADSSSVDFIWLDVACISQNSGVSEMTLEIGRQAAIFRKADAVLIWLHQQETMALRNALEVLIMPEPDVQELRNTLDNFMSDKWFSSLWTYQEAYLSQDMARFASKSGEVIPGILLKDLVNNCATMVKYYDDARDSTASHRSQMQKTMDEIYEILDRRGILALAQRNPFALYSAAWSRTSRLDWDKVYGIQQVFPLRVGTSVEGSNPGARYDKATLEAQLGRLLLERFPVQSQLHVFNEPVEDGRAWHISPASRVPHLVLYEPLYTYCFESHCTLAAVDDENTGVSWAQYDGYATPFHLLREKWKDLKSAQTKEDMYSGYGMFFQICLDVTRGMRELTPNEKPGYRCWGHRYDIIDEVEQRYLADWLIQTYAREHLWIALLGSMVDESREPRYLSGLILVGEEDDKKRLGVCVWRYVGESDDVISSFSWRRKRLRFN